ncbi:MAG: hypothetical protein M3436_13030 [Pseudomonadota bacterium]|nr:hypothetical protein [Pseudomonadota bacterium]
MPDWLKQFWRSVSELDTLVSLVSWLKIFVGVGVCAVTWAWSWVTNLPGPVQFVLALSALLVSIWVINGILWLRQWRASHKKLKVIEMNNNQFPKGIDTQWGWPDISSLAENFSFSITLRMFNGTAFKVRVRTEGLMSFDNHQVVRHASLIGPDNIEWIPRWSPVTFTLVQRLSPEDAKHLRTLLDNGETVNFFYNTFKILVTAMGSGGDKSSALTENLPFNEQGLTISNGLVVGQIQLRTGTT